MRKKKKNTQQQQKYQKLVGEEIMNIRAEINKKEMKETIKKINKTKS